MGGTFWGFRGAPPAGPAPGGRLTVETGRIPYASETYAGNAPDAYGAMIGFSQQSAILLIQVWDEAAIIQVSKDGITYQDQREIDPDNGQGTILERLAEVGIRIKNKTPGSVSRYQIVPFW